MLSSLEGVWFKEWVSPSSTHFLLYLIGLWNEIG
jgi:hypothetical protein